MSDPTPLTQEEKVARTAARMKWFKENLSPEEWEQVIPADDPEWCAGCGQKHSKCECAPAAEFVDAGIVHDSEGWGFCPHCGDWCVLDVHGVAACGENR